MPDMRHVVDVVDRRGDVEFRHVFTLLLLGGEDLKVSLILRFIKNAFF
jgi:hypothetical protein